MARAKRKRAPKKAPKKAPKRKRSVAEFCGCPSGAKMVYDEEGGVCRTNRGKGKRVALSCSTTSPAYKVGQPKMGRQLATPSSFDYWTPSVVTPRTAGQRKAGGCVIETIEYVSKKGKRKGQTLTKKVSLPYRCPPGSTPNEANGTCLAPGGKALEPVRDPQCGPQANPCAQSRKTCPVQLVYRGGRPNLRFCVKAGNKQPGFLVPVKGATEANKLAEDACAHWKKSKKKFTKANPAYKLATQAYPETEGLGRRRTTKRAVR